MTYMQIIDQIPDCTYLNIFSYLNGLEITKASTVCKRWLRIAKDEQLWKRRFRIDFNVQNIDLSKSISWLSEYRRFVDQCPRMAVHKLNKHKEQVLHVSFSHNGAMLSTCSKDGTLKVWSTKDWKVVHDKNLRQLLYWKYTLCSKFNESDRLILVSGLRGGESASVPQNDAGAEGTIAAMGLGELAVFEFLKKEKPTHALNSPKPEEELVFRCRAINEPFDVYGCWFDNDSILNGQSRRFNQTSTMSDMYFLHAATEQTTSTRLFQFYNPTGGIVRNLRVSSYIPGSTTDKAQMNRDRLLLFTTGTRMDTPHQIGVKYIKNERITGPMLSASRKGKATPDKAPMNKAKEKEVLKPDLKPVQNDQEKPKSEEKQSETKVDVASGTDKTAINSKDKRNDEPGPSLSEPKAQPISHPEQGAISSEDESDDENSLVQQVQIRVHTFDKVDHVIETHGRIMGLALSPDQRYMFLHIHPFMDLNFPPDTHQQNSPMIQNDLEIRTIDLHNLCLLENNFNYTKNLKNNGAIPSQQAFFIGLDANDGYVLSGGNGSSAYLWDRRHSCLIRALDHDSGKAIHSVSLHPFDPDVCVTAADDGTVTVWYSKAKKRQENTNV